MIPPSVLFGLDLLAAQHGVDSSGWFTGVGLTPEECGRPETRISFEQAAEVIARAVRAMPHEPLGLLIGGRDPLVAFGLLGYAAVSSPTGEAAMTIAAEHHQAAGSLVDVTIERRGREVVLRAHERYPLPQLLPFLCEECFSACTALMRAALDERRDPVRVELAYRAPAYAASYRTFFRCEIAFECDANRLVLDAASLQRPLPRHDPANLAAALAACRVSEPVGATTDVVAAVERLLEQTHGARLSMGDVAAKLFKSERSLRRQLAADGETFSRIRDRVLARRAQALLDDGRRRPLSEIARELGFSDGRELQRAFRRWTGRPPRPASHRRDATL